MQQLVTLEPCVQGDRKDIRINFYKEGYDFTGVTAASKIRASSAVASVYTFTPAISSDSAYINTFTVVLTLPGATSGGLAVGTYIGDITVSISTTFGPFTPIRFVFDITEKIT